MIEVAWAIGLSLSACFIGGFAQHFTQAAFDPLESLPIERRLLKLIAIACWLMMVALVAASIALLIVARG